MVLDRKIPIVNIPIESGNYKCVQLDVDGKPFLRFARDDSENHSLILERMLIHSRVRNYGRITGTSGSSIPSLEGERYKVYGMGRSSVDLESKQISFRGDSYDYNIKISKTHLDKIRQLLSEWELNFP